MSTAAVEPEAPNCDDCSRKAEVFLCDAHRQDLIDEAVGEASYEPCDEPHGDPAQAVRDWLMVERLKPDGLTSAEIALLERCAEDLE